MRLLRTTATLGIAQRFGHPTNAGARCRAGHTIALPGRPKHILPPYYHADSIHCSSKTRWPIRAGSRRTSGGMPDWRSGDCPRSLNRRGRHSQTAPHVQQPREGAMSRSVTRRTFAKGGIALAAALVATAGTLPVTSAPTWAETWPSKPIKIVCAFPAGGLTDAVCARLRRLSLPEAWPAGDRREQGRCDRLDCRAGREAVTARRLYAAGHHQCDVRAKPCPLQEPGLRPRQRLRAHFEYDSGASAVRGRQGNRRHQPEGVRRIRAQERDERGDVRGWHLYPHRRC